MQVATSDFIRCIGRIHSQAKSPNHSCPKSRDGGRIYSISTCSQAVWWNSERAYWPIPARKSREGQRPSLGHDAWRLEQLNKTWKPNRRKCSWSDHSVHACSLESTHQEVVIMVNVWMRKSTRPLAASCSSTGQPYRRSHHRRGGLCSCSDWSALRFWGSSRPKR